MRTFHLLASAALLAFPAFASHAKKAPEPKGQPDYIRESEGWLFGAWHYRDSRAIHGRLQHRGKEVVGKPVGDILDTPIGEVVWRGSYSSTKEPHKSTGWLFVRILVGPDFIRDGYDPESGVLH